MKTPKCKTCGGEHYAFQCFQTPRKPIETRKPLQARKPLPSYTKPLQKPRKRIKAQSTNPRPVAVKELDRVFSIYIRVKDSHDGFAQCVTCPTRDLWKLMQNGHYIGRRNMAVRWDEVNCHVQCQYCNENLGGNLKVYKSFMLQNYGEDGLDALVRRANSGTKITLSEIYTLTDIYKNRIAKYLTP